MQAFNPILDWARQDLKAELIVSESILGAPQPEHVVQSISQALKGEQVSAEAMQSSSCLMWICPDDQKGMNPCSGIL